MLSSLHCFAFALCHQLIQVHHTSYQISANKPTTSLNAYTHHTYQAHQFIELSASYRPINTSTTHFCFPPDIRQIHRTLTPYPSPPSHIRTTTMVANIIAKEVVHLWDGVIYGIGHVLHSTSSEGKSSKHRRDERDHHWDGRRSGESHRSHHSHGSHKSSRRHSGGHRH